MAQIKLGELLIKANVLQESQLKAALAEQAKWGGKLGEILVRMNLVSEDILVRALSKQLAIPAVNLDAVKDIAKHILNRIPLQTARDFAVLPLQLRDDGKTLVVAIADPLNVRQLDELRAITKCRISPNVAGRTAIARAMARFYEESGELADADTNFKVVDSHGRTIVKSLKDIPGGVAAAAPRRPAPAAPRAHAQPALGGDRGGAPEHGQPRGALAQRGRGAAQGSGRPQGHGGAAHREGRLHPRRIPRQGQALAPWAPPSPMPKKIGELLIESGALSAEQVHTALGRQRNRGNSQRLGSVIITLGFASSAEVARALARQADLPFVQLPEEIDEAVRSLVSLDFQSEHRLVPFRLEREGRSERLHIAVDDPSDLTVAEELGFQLNKPIRIHVAAEDDLDRALGLVRGARHGGPPPGGG